MGDRGHAASSTSAQQQQQQQQNEEAIESSILVRAPVVHRHGLIKPKVLVAVSSASASASASLLPPAAEIAPTTSLSLSSVVTSTTSSFHVSPSTSFVPVIPVVTPPSTIPSSTADSTVTSSTTTSVAAVAAATTVSCSHYQPFQFQPHAPYRSSQYNNNDNHQPHTMGQPSSRSSSLSTSPSFMQLHARPQPQEYHLYRRRHHHYIAVTLRRPISIHCPWGLSISYRNGIVLVGSVVATDNDVATKREEPIDHKQQQRHVGVSEYHITNSWISPTLFFYKDSNHTHSTLANTRTTTEITSSTATTTKPYRQYEDRFWFRNHLLQQPPHDGDETVQQRKSRTNSASLLPTNAVIQPGDCIVQIVPSCENTIHAITRTSSSSTSSAISTNQKPLQYQQWDSLQSFIDTLRQSTTSVQLILYRHPHANIAVANMTKSIPGANVTTKSTTTATTNTMVDTTVDGTSPSGNSSSTKTITKTNQPQQQTHNYDATYAAFHVISSEFPILHQRGNTTPMMHPHIQSLSLSDAKRKLFPTTATSVLSPLEKKMKLLSSSASTIILKNRLFVDPVSGETGIPFDDNHCDVLTMSNFVDTDDQFILPPIPTNVTKWIAERKQLWRTTYQVYKFPRIAVSDEARLLQQTKNRRRDDNVEQLEQLLLRNSITSVSVDFWTQQGYSSFDHWLRERKIQWYNSYSWNRQSRQVIEQDIYNSPDMELLPLTNNTDGTVGLNSTTIPIAVWDRWLRIRKTQWKVLRRKRQRRLATTRLDGTDEYESTLNGRNVSIVIGPDASKVCVGSVESSPISQNKELMVIDAILEEQERLEREKRKEERQPFDISFIFDSSLGCPDDVVAKIFQYLPSLEHGKFICINNVSRNQIRQRDAMWKQLLPSHWTIPRRPRKSWQVLYTTNLRAETERARKLWDDLLSKASTILQHGDQLQAIEKLITDAQSGGRHKPASGFEIDYASGVVCERNSILNLAVIHQRQKVVRWLVEVKNADIESMDRGNFTPLLNAAWAGNKTLVRFLMQNGADRSKIGRFHYTKPVAPVEFEGLTAEGWAEQKGHHDVARVLHLGL